MKTKIFDYLGIDEAKPQSKAELNEDRFWKSVKIDRVEV